jgi:hypothetical protein
MFFAAGRFGFRELGQIRLRSVQNCGSTFLVGRRPFGLVAALNAAM